MRSATGSTVSCARSTARRASKSASIRRTATCLNRILSSWRAAGIDTEAAARTEHERHAAGQEPPAKEPMQRHAYTDEDFRRMVVDLDEEETPR